MFEVLEIIAASVCSSEKAEPAFVLHQDLLERLFLAAVWVLRVSEPTEPKLQQVFAFRQKVRARLSARDVAFCGFFRHSDLPCSPPQRYKMMG